MAELLTAAQMRAVEQAAISSGEVTGLELMERAGQGVIEAVFEEWPELAATSLRAVVLCGPGNNGGDGFVVARLLKARGWEVEVFLYGDPAKLPPDAQTNYERWCVLGEVHQLSELETADDLRLLNDAYARTWDFAPDLFVDAMFGTGLKRGLPHVLEDLAGDVLDQPTIGEKFSEFRVVSVDIPSGICADSGRVMADPGGVEGLAVKADLTVSFHREKVGHQLADGPLHCGKVVVKGIGLEGREQHLVEVSGDVVRLVGRGAMPGLGKTVSGHKYAHGHALILSGGPGRTGAARLAARGALRIGAGLVTLGVPPAAQQEVACQITALMLRRVADGTALAEVLEDTRINALCLGPGLGLSDERVSLVEAALKAGRPAVLDADALTLIGRHAALFAMLHEGCVLTPHGGEFARLFPDIAAKLSEPATKGPAYSKVDACREAAARVGCVVLFKGPDTVIARPDGRCSINSAAYDRAAPWLATAGSGDVLAGFIAGLLARGSAPCEAAQTAAWLHVEAARSFGPGLIAEDLPEALPAVFRALDL